MRQARDGRRSTTKLLGWSGALTLVAGVLWGVLFASVPYQDPTPDLAARFALHDSISSWMIAAGAFLLALGCLAWLFARGRVRRGVRPEHDE